MQTIITKDAYFQQLSLNGQEMTDEEKDPWHSWLSKEAQRKGRIFGLHVNHCIFFTFTHYEASCQTFHSNNFR